MISTPIAKDVQFGRDVRIFRPDLVNPFDCSVGDEARRGRFVEVQVGANFSARRKTSSHSVLYEGAIEDDVFIGHGVMFTNDGQRRATAIGRPQGRADWTVERASVGRRASIGSNATILCGITIGAGAIVGTGAVVHAGCSRMRNCGASVCAHPAGVRAGPQRIAGTAPSGRRSCL